MKPCPCGSGKWIAKNGDNRCVDCRKTRSKYKSNPRIREIKTDYDRQIASLDSDVRFGNDGDCHMQKFKVIHKASGKYFVMEFLSYSYACDWLAEFDCRQYYTIEGM